MAEREHEISDNDMGIAEKEAMQAVIAEAEKALSTILGNSPLHKIYATKKASKKKTDTGGQ